MSKHTSYTIERSFPFPPEKVYQGFVDPEIVQKWIWGGDAKNVKAEIDHRVAGRYYVECDAQGEVKEPWGDRWAFEGYIVIAEAGVRFSYLQRWRAWVGYNDPGMEPLDEVVDVVLTPSDGGCTLRYTHSGIPDDGTSAKHHQMAVNSTLNDLEKALAG